MDETPDCNDECPEDGDKVELGECGCVMSDIGSDMNGIADCNEACGDASCGAGEDVINCLADCEPSPGPDPGTDPTDPSDLGDPSTNPTPIPMPTLDPRAGDGDTTTEPIDDPTDDPIGGGPIDQDPLMINLSLIMMSRGVLIVRRTNIITQHYRIIVRGTRWNAGPFLRIVFSWGNRGF